NANLLQIENEYYSSIRPKRVAFSGERPTAALRRGGVEYVEIRALDINVFDPCGVNQNTMRFIEALLLYCLLMPSPPLDEDGLTEASRNQLTVAKVGRDPALELMRDGKATLLRDWAREIVEGVAAVAAVIDAQEGGESYAQALAAMQELVEDADATPSARMLEELRVANSSYFDFVLSASASHREYFSSIEPLAGERLAELERAAVDSLQLQRDIEAADTLTFDEYLEQYFARD
ncbi:MAG: glutamate--cysteine ligase, partial [Woeseiaceae bacterium]|nr:glutamate--cysteine ligase [Woeseiaceae bacterium]